jgi:hypothetical protein
MYLQTIFKNKITINNIFLAVFILGVSFPVRLTYNLGPFSSVSLLEMSIIITLLFIFLRSQIYIPIDIGNKALFLCLIIPTILTILSVVWTVDVNVTVKFFMQNLFAILCYLAGILVSNDLKSKTIMKTIGFIFCCWILSSIAMYMNFPGFSFFIPASSDINTKDLLNLMASIYTRLGHPFIGQSNDYAPLLAFLGFIFLGWYLHSKQLVYSIFCSLAFIGTLLSFSRGSAIGLIIGIIVYIYLSHFNAKIVISCAILVLCTFTAIIYSFRNTTFSFDDREMNVVGIIETRFESVNIEERLNRYKYAIALIKTKPILGYGAGVTELSEYEFINTSVHNTYLEKYLYYGFIFGTITIFCLISVCLIFVFISRQNNTVKPITYTFISAWVYILISANFETFLEASVPRSLIYMLLGLCYKLCFDENTENQNIQSGYIAT